VPLVDHLLEAGVRFRFDVYGDGDQFEPLRDAMVARFPQNCVQFHGRVPHDEMASVWSSHDVFIQTSDFEGTSVSMLEAMAYGVLPVVTAASSGITGVIRHAENGFVSRVGDMHGMAQILGRLAEDRSQLAAACVAAHRSAQAYTLEAYREQFTNVLDRVVESGEHIDLYKRYGMFGTAHPLFKQRQSIAKLESRVATLEGSALYKLHTRLFPRAHRRRMAG
jgi:glycosyltransferase involved in cell wall biosynthesis